MRQDITLDVRKRETSFGRAKLLPLRRGEKGNRELVVSIAENGVSYDLTGKAVRFLATTSAGKLVGPIGIEVADAAHGIVERTLPEAIASSVGTTEMYYEILEGDEVLDTTDSFTVRVIDSADLDSEQAAEFTPVLREMEQAVADTKRATTEANEAASHQPRIGESDTWEVWDIASAQYVDTGVAARGAQGIQGEPGKDGAPGEKGDPGEPGAPGSDAQATDVRINGKSITADGVADIPISGGSTIGVVMTDNESGGFSTGLVTVNNRLYLKNAAHVEITNRISRVPILANNVDYAVKAAMCDGKGAAWTDAEKSAARERLGVDGGGSSNEAGRIWLLPSENLLNVPDEGSVFNTEDLISIYPDDNGSFPFTVKDVIFCGGYIFTFCIDPGSYSSEFIRRYRFF